MFVDLHPDTLHAMIRVEASNQEEKTMRPTWSF